MTAVDERRRAVRPDATRHPAAAAVPDVAARIPRFTTEPHGEPA